MKAECLAAWYFRLNGFFTITNFVLHPSRRGSQRTDADIVGVRFPYRSEFPDSPGGDIAEFIRFPDKPYFLIAEVKRSLCELNGPWRDSNKQNIQAVLRDLGLFPPEQVGAVAESLYERGIFDGPLLYCSLFCVGDIANTELARSHPHVPQHTWEQVLGFLFERFQTYQERKADHDSWDEIGKELWNFWKDTPKTEFINKVKGQIN